MLADDLLEIAPRRFTIKLLMSRSAAALPDNADAGTVLEVLQKKGAARRREIADKQKLGKTATRSRIRELVTHGLIEQVGKGPASRHRIKTHLT
ncbi:winged helix-turn-helix transcriptional regulator [Duodenibacillus massiliensis]|uniref:winged helix-turn-helix transcriptional regulator n=1 Tax=Duodenibacillus massiliensis TaxID=1852381 RepID=UPI0030777F25